MVKTKTSPQKREPSKLYVDRLMKSKTFEPFDRPSVGEKFWRPRRRGDTIRGHIGAPIQNFRQATSYPIEIESGKVYEFVANKQFHKLYRDSEALGRLVEIEYVGRQYTHNGHYRKIYRLFIINFKG